jgi:membrane associated rhomboid family serine protease
MQSPFTNIPPVVKNLLIINIICLLPSAYFTHGFATQYDPVAANFGLYYFNSPDFRPWQIITYMFLHGGWAHILFNMFALFSFGPILEYTIGSKKFFTLYFICGVGAGVFQLLVQGIEMYHYIGVITLPHDLRLSAPEVLAKLSDPAIFSKINDIMTIPVVGASGAIFGLLIAFGMLYPNMELMIMFIPVPVKAKYIIPVYCVFELFMGIGQFGGDNVAHFAHIGGALLGFIMVKAWGLKSPNNFS